MKNNINCGWLLILLLIAVNPIWSQCEFDEVILTSPTDDYASGDEIEISAWTSIEASNTIDPGANVLYASDGSIQLNEGFFASEGSDFLAKLGCSVSAVEPNFESFVSVNPNPVTTCLLYTSPSPRDKRQSRMPSSA